MRGNDVTPRPQRWSRGPRNTRCNQLSRRVSDTHCSIGRADYDFPRRARGSTWAVQPARSVVKCLANDDWPTLRSLHSRPYKNTSLRSTKLLQLQYWRGTIELIVFLKKGITLKDMYSPCHPRRCWNWFTWYSKHFCHRLTKLSMRTYEP